MFEFFSCFSSRKDRETDVISWQGSRLPLSKETVRAYVYSAFKKVKKSAAHLGSFSYSTNEMVALVILTEIAAEFGKNPGWFLFLHQDDQNNLIDILVKAIKENPEQYLNRHVYSLRIFARALECMPLTDSHRLNVADKLAGYFKDEDKQIVRSGISAIAEMPEIFKLLSVDDQQNIFNSFRSFLRGDDPTDIWIAVIALEKMTGHPSFELQRDVIITDLFKAFDTHTEFDRFYRFTHARWDVAHFYHKLTCQLPESWRQALVEDAQDICHYLIDHGGFLSVSTNQERMIKNFLWLFEDVLAEDAERSMLISDFLEGIIITHRRYNPILVATTLAIVQSFLDEGQCERIQKLLSDALIRSLQLWSGFILSGTPQPSIFKTLDIAETVRDDLSKYLFRIFFTDYDNPRWYDTEQTAFVTALKCLDPSLKKWLLEKMLPSLLDKIITGKRNIYIKSRVSEFVIACTEEMDDEERRYYLHDVMLKKYLEVRDELKINNPDNFFNFTGILLTIFSHYANKENVKLLLLSELSVFSRQNIYDSRTVGEIFKFSGLGAIQ